MTHKREASRWGDEESLYYLLERDLERGAFSCFIKPNAIVSIRQKEA